ELPQDVRHPRVVRERDAHATELGGALVRRRAPQEGLRRRELAVRVVDLGRQRRGLRPLRRDNRVPPGEDQDQQRRDREQEGEPPVDPAGHFAPPFGLKPAVTENVSPPESVPLVPVVPVVPLVAGGAPAVPLPVDTSVTPE